MDFREMAIDDIAEVARLYTELACFIKDESQDDYFNFDTLSETAIEQNLKESLGESSRITLVAKDGGRVTGFISGEVKDCFLPFSKIKKIGYIGGAYVLPGFRNQGIMRHLESLLLAYFKNQGLTYVELNVITNNFLGKRSWESLGYQTFREQMRKKIYWNN
jgi:ribosomal protein S18 acetylase RimI-like enzyme